MLYSVHVCFYRVYTGTNNYNFIFACCFYFNYRTDKLNGEEENDEEDVNEDDSKSSKVKFDWESIITEVLKKKGEMPLKKLRKKVY